MSTLITNNVLDLDGNVLLAKGQAAKYVESLQDLLAANMESHKVVNVLNYHTGLEGGGGVFYWDASKPKAEHNGGTVIDPAKAFPTDWNNQTQLTDWFTAGSSGTGCWVRQYDGAVNVKWFGAKDDLINPQDTSLTAWLSYVVNNSLHGLGDSITVVISSVISVVSVSDTTETNIDFNGMKIIVLNSFPVTLDTFVLLSIQNLNKNESSYATVKNLTIDCSAVTPVMSTTPENRAGLGSFYIKNFNDVFVENITLKGMFYSRGLMVVGFNNLMVDGYLAKDVGGKFNWNNADVSDYDAAGDAIYLSDVVGANATATINNVRANGQVLGRAGVVTEYIGEGNHLTLLMKNCHFDNYNRIVHTEDQNRSDIEWVGGSAKNFGIFHFSLETSNDCNFRFSNLKIDVNPTIAFGGNSGLTVYFGSTHTKTVTIFDNCEITYTSSTLESSFPTLNNCKLYVNAIPVFRQSGYVFNGCELYFTGSNYLDFFSSVQQETANQFLNCKMEAATTYSTLYCRKNGVIFENVTAKNISVNHENSTLTSYFRNSVFTYTDSAVYDIFVGSAAKKEFDGCSIINNTTVPLKIYGDGGSINRRISNCFLVNTRIEYINAFTNDNTPIVQNLQQYFNTSSTQVTAIYFYNSRALFNSYILIQDVDTITPPTSSDYIKYTGSFSVNSLGVITAIT